MKSAATDVWRALQRSALFNDDRLVSNPDQVATDDNISWVGLATASPFTVPIGWVHRVSVCAWRTHTLLKVISDARCKHTCYTFGVGWLQDVSTHYWKTRVHNLSGVSAGQFGATTRCASCHLALRSCCPQPQPHC